MRINRFSTLCEQGAVRGKRVFIRADLNVPLDANCAITEDTRIRMSIECIRMALRAGGAVMVASHLGRPDVAAPKPEDSLAPVAARLGVFLNREIPLVKNWVDGVSVAPGEVVLLENCRLNAGEKQNDESFSKKLASICDIYVNDAFGAAHRSEATIVGMARFAPQACAGPLMAAEVDAIEHVIQAPQRPLVALVGGSKVSTKLTVLCALVTKVDQLIVGGGMANTFMLAAGLPIGSSLAEPALVAEARAILDAARARGASVPLPTDVVTAKEFAASAPARIKRVCDVAPDDLILDVGPETAARLAEQLQRAGTIVWNGPVGVFEWDAFAHGTEVVARAIATSGAFSVAGGGDTLAAIAKYQLEGGIDYISTGGGAFLEMLEGKKLPALAVLEQRAAVQ